MKRTRIGHRIGHYRSSEGEVLLGLIIGKNLCEGGF
jgi:hypothetical protein